MIREIAIMRIAEQKYIDREEIKMDEVIRKVKGLIEGNKNTYISLMLSIIAIVISMASLLYMSYLNRKNTQQFSESRRISNENEFLDSILKMSDKSLQLEGNINLSLFNVDLASGWTTMRGFGFSLGEFIFYQKEGPDESIVVLLKIRKENNIKVSYELREYVGWYMKGIYGIHYKIEEGNVRRITEDGSEILFLLTPKSYPNNRE